MLFKFFDRPQEGARVAIFRSERYAAMLLLVAAVLGLLFANSAFGPDLLAFKSAHFEIPWLGLDLSIGHFVSDGLLAIFFFIEKNGLFYFRFNGNT